MTDSHELAFKNINDFLDHLQLIRDDLKNGINSDKRKEKIYAVFLSTRLKKLLDKTLHDIENMDQNTCMEIKSVEMFLDNNPNNHKEEI